MKNDSKERLEKQLNENPELKERFNLQMKSITDDIRALTEPLKEFADVKALENLSSPLEAIMNSFKAIKPTTATQSIVESLELFNLRLKPLLDSITSDEHKEMILLMDKTKIEYTSLCKGEKEFIKHERLYVPNDVYEFLDWYLYCYLFDKPFDVRKEKELTLYHFNLFYKFKQRYKTHEKWDVCDERKFIKELESSDSENKENVSDEDKRAIIKEYTFSESEDKNNIVENDEPKPKITAKHHALAYIFDCDAKGQKTKVGRKKELEQIGRARSDNKIDGNTFYKAFNEVMQVDRNKERDLTYIAGEDWRNIIIRLSKDADKLDKYLKTKDL